MKRIWFTQQKEYEYIPLRYGLGYITAAEARKLINKIFIGFSFAPKIFTTRTHRLSGEYYVVQGSRFKAVPVEPRIEFRVDECQEITLEGGCSDVFLGGEEFHAALDLGLATASYNDFRDLLLKLNPRITLDTPLYVNRLMPINGSNRGSPSKEKEK